MPKSSLQKVFTPGLELEVVKAFDPNQPRDEEGEWSSTGGSSTLRARPKVTGGSTRARNLVVKGVAAIPAEHAEMISGVKVSVVDGLSSVAMMQGKNTIGLFDWEGGPPGEISIAEKVPVEFNGKVIGTVPVKDLPGTVVHELGHALDYKMNWRLGHAINKQVMSDIGAAGSRDIRNAAYYTAKPKEMFAELYNVAYNPSTSGSTKFFGGMSRKRAETVFAKSLSTLRTEGTRM